MSVENGGNVRRLTTWKEIATFLGRDERTVKRWEESRGLPVRRVPGSGRASVFAYAHELQAWLDGARPEPAAMPTPAAKPKFAITAMKLAAALLVLGVAAWLLNVPPKPLPEPAHDPAAVALYRSGLHEWQTRTPSGLARAVKDFDAAIARAHKRLQHMGFWHLQTLRATGNRNFSLYFSLLILRESRKFERRRPAKHKLRPSLGA